MKNLFFALAFMLMGTFAFANNITDKNIETIATEVDDISYMNTIEVRIETKIVFEEVVCYRTCYYQGGELLGCTAWKCEKISTESLDPVVIQP